MSGSGNDFVVLDARTEPPGSLSAPECVSALCERALGVGADGVVFIERSSIATVKMTYLNRDGSVAAMCGNAALCSTRLAVELGAASAEGFTLETDSGTLDVRMRGGRAEIDLAPVSDVRESVPVELQRGERRIGYALVGVPHVVIVCDDVESIDVVGRGRPLRRSPLFEHGANVNFVTSTSPGVWRMRTYERGVEAETLACGTGAVSVGILLRLWGQAEDRVEIETKSGRRLTVRLRQSPDGWNPSLSGESRIVFEGRLGEFQPAR